MPNQGSTSTIINVEPNKPQVNIPTSVVTPAPVSSEVPVADWGYDNDKPKRYIPIITTIVGLITLSVSITTLIIGVAGQSECPIQYWIPRWLIGLGTAGLIGAVALIVLVSRIYFH